MLKVLRDNLKQLKWILILVVASFIITIFAVWGGGGFRQSEDQAPRWAALVNGEAISIPDFQNAARKIDEFYSRLYGDRYSEIRKSLNLGAQVMNELIDEKIILQEAKSLGITATPEEVSQKIVTHPAFMENGIFIGKERYMRLLEATNKNIADFEREIRDSIIMDKWRDLIGDSMYVSDIELEKEYRAANEKVTFDYVFLPSANFEKDINITDDEARRFFDLNSNKYKKGELRRAKFVLLSRDEVKKDVQVSEDEIRSYYQSNISNFEQPEQVAAKHILIKVDAGSPPDVDEKAKKKAEEILAKIRAGGNFEALAKEFSQDEGSAQNGGDIGRFPRGMMAKEFEDAAFSLQVGQLSDIIKTQFGYHIIKVYEKIPARITTLDEVKDRIRKQLEYDRTQELLERRMEKIKAEMKSPEQFDEVAKTNNLKVMDTGFITRDQRVPELGTGLEFQKVLFSIQPFQIGGPVLVSRGLAILLFTEKQEGKAPTFEPVREEVIRDLRAQRSAERAYEELRTAFSDSGRNIEALAKRFKLQVQNAKDISRKSNIPGVGMYPSLVGDLLATSPGTTQGPFRTPRGSLVAATKDVIRFDPVKFAKERESFRANLLNGMQERLIANIVRNLKAQKDIRINTDLIRQTGI